LLSFSSGNLFYHQNPDPISRRLSYGSAMKKNTGLHRVESGAALLCIIRVI
jgi:hypothetical protein